MLRRCRYCILFFLAVLAIYYIHLFTSNVLVLETYNITETNEIRKELSSKSKERYRRIWNGIMTDVEVNLFLKNKTKQLEKNITTSIMLYYAPIESNFRSPPNFTGEIGIVNEATNRKGACFPSRKWHLFNPITCNSMHEIDMLNGLTLGSYTPSKTVVENNTVRRIKLLTSGSQRDAWVLSSYLDGGYSENSPIILKKLRYIKDNTQKKKIT